MKQKIQLISILAAMAFLFACGEEYYSTPQKTLEHYVKNRMMGSRQENEACLHSFTQADQDWWRSHYVKLCYALYGQDCPGESISTEATVWTDKFEPAGPGKPEVQSTEIDEKAGTAWLTVDGQDIEFVKEKGNWKMKGMFGVPEEMEQKYPQIK
jgi:hypothetical protein